MSEEREQVARVFALLRYAMPESEAARTAEKLIDIYGAASTVMEAGARQLTGDGLTEREAQLLAMIPQLAQYTARENLGPRPSMSTFDKACDYFRTFFIGVHYERFYLASLNKQNRLIRCEALTHGSLREVAIYPRLVLEMALQDKAASVVCCHNHPGGSTTFTESDVNATRQTMTLLGNIGIPLQDHVLIANEKTVSMRAKRLISDEEWMRLCPSAMKLDKWVTDIRNAF